MIGGSISKITVEIGGKLAASLTASLRAAQAQVSSFSRNVTRTFNDAATAGAKGFKGMLRNDAFQVAAAGAASIGLALGQSVRTAARFETALTEIGKISGSSQSELKQLGAQLSALSARNMTNLAPTVLADGVQDLVAQGLNLKDAVASMEALGKVATATGSELTDVTKTGFQLQNALKIRPTELKSTFDALAYAGKQGAFELKDMAQFMPTIAAAAGTLGIQGRQGAIALASMMQMVRKDAPDAGQAATRMTDAMLKMTAPDAVKNFKKFGVNIEQVLANAKKKGVNPMEAALDELQRVTGGDVFKLSQIFGDKEAKLALMSLLKYRKEYEKLKADAGGSAAAGTVEQDYLKSINTLNGNLKTFKATTERLGVALGNALLPAISTIAKAITPLVEGFAALAEKAPFLTNTIVGVGAAFVGLVAALPFIASFISVVKVLGGALVALKLGATIAGWAGAIGPALAAIKVGLVALTGPIGLTIAAIVGVGLAIKAVVDYWPEIKTAATRAWWQVRAVWDQFTGWIGGVFNQAMSAASAAWGQFTTFISGVFNQAIGVISTWGPRVLAIMFPIPAAILGAFGQLPPGVQGVFNQVVAFIQGVPGQLVDVGRKIIDTIIEGIKARASALVDTVRATFAEVRNLMPFSDAKEGPFKYLTSSGKAIITTLAHGVNDAAPRLARAMDSAAAGAMGSLSGATMAPAMAIAGAPSLTAAGVPVRSRPVVPNYSPIDVPAPAPGAGRSGMGSMSMSPTVNVNVAGSSSTADDIAEQVMRVFEDMLGEAEASVRAYLND